MKLKFNKHFFYIGLIIILIVFFVLYSLFFNSSYQLKNNKFNSFQLKYQQESNYTLLKNQIDLTLNHSISKKCQHLDIYFNQNNIIEYYCYFLKGNNSISYHYFVYNQKNQTYSGFPTPEFVKFKSENIEDLFSYSISFNEKPEFLLAFNNNNDIKSNFHNSYKNDLINALSKLEILIKKEKEAINKYENSLNNQT